MINIITTDAVVSPLVLMSNFKLIKQKIEILETTGGGSGAVTSAIIDGGNPSTNHSGNLKIDFGSIN